MTSLRSHRTSEGKLKAAPTALQTQTGMSGIIRGSFWNSHYKWSCTILGHGKLTEMLDRVQCNEFPTSYYCMKAKYTILGYWKSIRSRMTQYELVLSSAQQIAQLFILKITQPLQPTSSKTTLILKEKNRMKQKQTPKPSWHLRAMGSDAVSDTAGHMTFSKSFPTLPHFPACERDQKFLPLVSSSGAVRTDGYLHSFLNATKTRKRQNIV